MVWDSHGGNVCLGGWADHYEKREKPNLEILGLLSYVKV